MAFKPRYLGRKMRHHRLTKQLLIATVLLTLGVMITAVRTLQQANGRWPLLSLIAWLLFFIVATWTIQARMENGRWVRQLGIGSLFLLLLTVMAVAQRPVLADSAIATTNRVLTPLSALTMGGLTLLYSRFRHAQMKQNQKIRQGVYLRLKPQPEQEAMSAFWARFPMHPFAREGVRPSQHITFELRGSALQKELGMFVAPDETTKGLLLQTLTACWPGVEMESVKEEAFNLSHFPAWADLTLEKEDKYPLFTVAEREWANRIETERLAGLLSAVQPEAGSGQMGIQFLVRVAPAHIAESWRNRVNQITVQLSQRGARTIGNLEGTSRQTTTIGPQNVVQLQQEQQLLSPRIAVENRMYELVVRIWASHPVQEKATQLLENGTATLIAQLSGTNKLKLSNRKGTDWETIRQRPFPDRGGFIVTDKELEAVCRMPTKETVARFPALRTSGARKLPPQPAVVVDSSQIAGYIAGAADQMPMVRVYGRIQHGAETRHIGHTFSQTHTHLLGTGATGSGKSVLAQHIIFQDWFHGNGVLVLDPHGTLIDDILAKVPFGLEERVLILDPESPNPFKYNICEIGHAFGLDRTVDALMEALRVAMGVSWESSVGMQQILRNALILGLASDPACDMVHVFHMLDPQKRAHALKKVKRKAVGSVRMAVAFWEEKFPTWDKPTQSRAVGAAERRIGVFVQSAAIRRTLGTRGASVDLAAALNSGKLILAPMGNLDEGTKRLWSAILVREVIHILMRRGSDDHRPVTLVFDEMKATIGTLGTYVQTIVEELRKYRAAGVFFAQSFSQLPQDVVLALKANCRTQIVMSTGADDAQIAADVLGEVQPTDIQNLPAYHAYAKIFSGGAQERACLIQLLPPKKKEKNPASPPQKVQIQPPNGVYHPNTRTLEELDGSASDDEIAAYLSAIGSAPDRQHEALLFLKSQSRARVERLLWMQKGTLSWMQEVVRANPKLLCKEQRIRLYVHAAIGTPWWWSDYLFEQPSPTEAKGSDTLLEKDEWDIVQ